MSYGNYEFEGFSSKEGFNKSLSHFQSVSSLLSEIEDFANPADLLSELLAEGEIEQNQLAPTIKALLADKYGYSYASVNLLSPVTDFSAILDTAQAMKAVDLVIAYLHPELGFSVINPKNPTHWKQVRELKKNELLTVYAGSFKDDGKNKKLYEAAAELIIKILEGKKAGVSDSLKKGKHIFIEKKAEPKRAAKPKTAKKRPPAASRKDPAARAEAPVQKQQPAEEEPAPSASRRMTPFYSVPVTNELFHNGNVEAWKKIIQSYQTKHPDLDVYIFYDGEKINDIHALFKWGKVKHGSTILFSVAGEDIKDVAKLQRYLRQGASPRFEDFLRFPVNTVLNLF